MTDWKSRKAAQRAVSLTGKVCENCSGVNRLQRHHRDYSKPTEVQILCQNCHVKADQRDGFRRVKAKKRCKVCDMEFLPKHSRKHATCSRECLSELGRMNAMKRWTSGNKNQMCRVSLVT
jgi:protein-arginine kinase activator protein McsA